MTDLSVRTDIRNVQYGFKHRFTPLVYGVVDT